MLTFTQLSTWLEPTLWLVTLLLIWLYLRRCYPISLRYCCRVILTSAPQRWWLHSLRALQLLVLIVLLWVTPTNPLGPRCRNDLPFWITLFLPASFFIAVVGTSLFSPAARSIRYRRVIHFAGSFATDVILHYHWGGRARRTVAILADPR